MKIEAYADRQHSHAVLILQAENLDDFRDLCQLHDHIHFELDLSNMTEPAVEVDSKQRQMRILIHSERRR